MQDAPKQLIHRAIEALGFRLLRDTVYVELVERMQASESTVKELKQREIENAERFRAELVEVSDEVKRLRTALNEQTERSRISLRDAEMSRERMRWSNAMFEQLLARQRRDFGGWSQSVIGQRGPDARRRSLVVLVTANTQVTQLKALANSEPLRSSYDVTVVAYVDIEKSGVLNLCKNSGLRLLSYDLKLHCGDGLNLAAEPEHAHPSTDVEAALRTWRPIEDASRMQEIALFYNEVKDQKNVATAAQRVLNATAADLLVLFEDHAEYATGIWVDVADRSSIPSVILPYTIADQVEPAEAYALNESYWPENGVYNRLAEIAFPHWLYQHGQRWLLRRPGVRLMAAEALGVAPPIPWILNSSRATAIAVESKAMREHYLKHEIPEVQLVTTGSMTDDLMHRAQEQKDELRRSLDLTEGKPVLLCGLPPNQLTAPRPQCQFSDFRDLVDFWLNELKRVEGWDVLVKVHPGTRPEDADYIRKTGVRISDLETTSLIPLCDLYNPSVSSTIRWALACGKPVLNYDVFRYRYREFASEPAVLTVFDSDVFSNELLRLTQDKPSLQGITDNAATAALRWGMNDGRSMERILALFDRLVARRGVPADLP